MTQPVPLDDLPDNLVPADDLPGATSAKSNIVTPDLMQKRMGIRKPRVKDDNFGSHVFGAFNDAGYDVGGAVTDMAAKVLPPEAAAGLGYVANVATDSVPMLLGGSGAKAATVGMREAKATDLMAEALKAPKTAWKKGDAEKAIKTLLEEGINVSKGGVEKLTARIDELDDALGAAIKGSKASLQRSDVLIGLKDVMEEYRAATKNAGSLDAIREVARDMVNHPRLRGRTDIPVQVAQDMKRANYHAIGDAGYGTGLKPAAERDALKSVTEGLRIGLEKAVPEAGAINAEMGPLINARNLAQDRVMMNMNNNSVGLGALIRDPKMFALWMADRSPMAKSLMARSLYSGWPAGGAGQVAGGILGATTANEEGILSRRTAWMGEGAK